MTKYRNVLILIILSLLPFLITFLNPNLPHTSDGGVQLPRMAAYFKALSDGHFPVRWAGDLNYGYGLPLFNFIYQFPFWATSTFIAFGFSLVFSFKLALYLSYVFSGIGMYLLAGELSKNRQTALITAILYLFAPFRFVELLIRGALGGVYAYTFAPLVLYAILKKNIPLTAVFAVLLILSHNSLSLVFFAIAVLFVLMFNVHKIRSFLGLALGLGLSAFFWIPAMWEHKYTYGDLFMKDLFRQYFPPIQNLFIPNPLYNPKLLTGEISTDIGLVNILLLLTALILLFNTFRAQRHAELVSASSFQKTGFRTKFGMTELKIVFFSLTITTVSLFFISPLSMFVWERVSWLRQFQFSWRFLAPVTFALPLLYIPISQRISLNAKTLIAILSAVILMTAFYWYPRQGFDKVNENDFWNYPLNTTYFGETDLIWSAGPASDYPKQFSEIIAGEGHISNITKKTQIHTYPVLADSQVTVVDHTQYFPGWKVYSGNAQIPIQFQDPNWRGQITYSLPPGDHSIVVKFTESPVRMIADFISLMTLAIILFTFKKMSAPHTSR